LDQWAKKQGVPEDKISIVPNGVDIDKFYFKNEEYNGEEVRLVTTSRLVYKNGLDLVIRALPLLPANIKFYIAGTGPEENSLKSLAKDLKVVDKIKWLGFIEYDKLPELLHQSTIFVRPSRTEGLGNSFLEAMSCGVSVVATCVGGIADFLVDRETGFVCQSENPQSIADSIKFIVGKDNQDLVAEVRQGAREMVEERYSWKHVTGQMDNIFESLL
jgi:glycosyltransferase involved in cell wall biosynthesis